MTGKTAKQNRVDWLGWEAHIGKMPDRQLAQRIGCSPDSVSQARQRRGIPAYQPPHTVDWNTVTDLGVETDAAIAARLGITAAAVCGMRRRRGIPSARPKHRRRLTGTPRQKAEAHAVEVLAGVKNAAEFPVFSAVREAFLRGYAMARREAFRLPLTPPS